MRVKNINKVLIFVGVLVIAVFSPPSCKMEASKFSIEGKTPDLADIQARGRLIAVTNFTSTNYFVYKGTPMGFQYELLKEFADYTGLKLEVRVTNDTEQAIEQLKDGQADLIAVNLTVTNERGKDLDFSVPLGQTRQVLVQRKPASGKASTSPGNESGFISDPIELAGKRIHVPRGSAYAARLRNLSSEIGDSIHIVELPGHHSEQLIGLVASGEIEYTICDEDLALVNKLYYPGIDVSTAVSFSQYTAWAVNKGSSSLLDEVNNWLTNFRQTKKFAQVYNKYYRNPKVGQHINNEYFSMHNGRISQYDELFKKHAASIGWDWRLLASLVYQESRFRHDVKSWAGAFGIMQFMPATAEYFGVDSLSPIEKHIEAGVKFIRFLDNILGAKIENEEERIKFILASYNLGIGHVLDARRLTIKHGRDPELWENNVEYYLMQKSQPEFYLDPVVKFGYCRGTETYNYVHQVMDRYNHYRNIITE